MEFRFKFPFMIVGLSKPVTYSRIWRILTSQRCYSKFDDGDNDYFMEEDSNTRNQRSSYQHNSNSGYRPQRQQGRYGGGRLEDDWGENDYQMDDEYSFKNQRNGYQRRPNNKFGSNRSWGRNDYQRDGDYSPRNQRNNYYERPNDRFGINSNKSSFSMAGESLSKPDWSSSTLESVEKNFYKPSDKALNYSAEEVENFRKKNNMNLKGKDIPNPIFEFEDCSFPKEIIDPLLKKGFQSPTPIQAQGWPIALSGRDLVGIGQTGSGKTLGFIIPALIHINHQPPIETNEGPIGLVMAPTRELAQQIHAVTNEAARYMNVKTACLYGGAGKVGQSQTLLRKPSVCIATPGRLLDFLEMGVINLKRCTYLVLDEADRMLDMGFEPQIRKIIDQIRPDRQTLMWSATWPKDVHALANEFMENYITFNVGSTELVANPNISQIVEVCDVYEKYEKFLEQLRSSMEEVNSKILVFAETKIQVDFLTRKLWKEGIKARGIHGNHSQTARNESLEGFRNGSFHVLVATNVAARGLDVDDISMVVNYDFPNCIEDYVHRIGRTARAGKNGKSLSFLTEKDAGMVADLIKVLKQGKQPVNEELFQLMEMKNLGKQRKPFRGSSRSTEFYRKHLH